MGVSLARTDWTALSAALGVPGWRARDEAELERSLAEALAGDGAALIAMQIDPSGYGGMLRAIRG